MRNLTYIFVFTIFVCLSTMFFYFAYQNQYSGKSNWQWYLLALITLSASGRVFGYFVIEGMIDKNKENDK